MARLAIKHINDVSRAELLRRAMKVKKELIPIAISRMKKHELLEFLHKHGHSEDVVNHSDYQRIYAERGERPPKISRRSRSSEAMELAAEPDRLTQEDRDRILFWHDETQAYSPYRKTGFDVTRRNLITELDDERKRADEDPRELIRKFTRNDTDDSEAGDEPTPIRLIRDITRNNDDSDSDESEMEPEPTPVPSDDEFERSRPDNLLNRAVKDYRASKILAAEKKKELIDLENNITDRIAALERGIDKLEEENRPPPSPIGSPLPKREMLWYNPEWARKNVQWSTMPVPHFQSAPPAPTSLQSPPVFKRKRVKRRSSVEMNPSKIL